MVEHQMRSTVAVVCVVGSRKGTPLRCSWSRSVERDLRTAAVAVATTLVIVERTSAAPGIAPRSSAAEGFGASEHKSESIAVRSLGSAA